MILQHFPLNPNGRDFVVGDIHGCFTALEEALASVKFDGSKDRLFSVGDLVDRGKESDQVMDWLNLPWFFAVRGNHEQMAINSFADGHKHAFQYVRNGGRWFIDLSKDEQQCIAARFEALPIAIEVETPDGLVGIIHAEVPANDWDRVKVMNKATIETAMWCRDRIYSEDQTPIANISKVYVGHTPLNAKQVLGNVHYIDTGIVFGGTITLEQFA